MQTHELTLVEKIQSLDERRARIILRQLEMRMELDQALAYDLGEVKRETTVLRSVGYRRPFDDGNTDLTYCDPAWLYGAARILYDVLSIQHALSLRYWYDIEEGEMGYELVLHW